MPTERPVSHQKSSAYCLTARGEMYTLAKKILLFFLVALSSSAGGVQTCKPSNGVLAGGRMPAKVPGVPTHPLASTKSNAR
eukprot:scaffold83890_cov17-Prasinocladus_malaysianus.AAC.1